MKIGSHLQEFFKSKTQGFYARALLSCAVALILGAALLFFAPEILRGGKDNTPPSASLDKNPPHYDEIMRIIRPLNYSGFYMFQKPGVTLSIDFKGRTWALHGLRRYTPDGTLLLDDAQNGLCAELVYHTFQKLSPLLSKPWEIKFVQALEPDFFSEEGSNHVVLILGAPGTKTTYLLDPSFHRYGATADFPQYTVLGAKDSLPSFEKNDPDVRLPVNDSFPVLIRNHSLILLSVESVSGSLDPKNFILAISARGRSKTSSHYLLALHQQAGKTQWLRNENAMKKFFSLEEAKQIKDKFVEWMGTL